MLRLMPKPKASRSRASGFLMQSGVMRHSRRRATVDNHIASLRSKLEKNPDEPRWITTVHGWDTNWNWREMNIEHRTSNANIQWCLMNHWPFDVAISVGRASSQPDPDEPRWLKTVHAWDTVWKRG